jgi:hypothetical protein
MSAWIVDRAHIDVLVQALAEGEHVTDVDPDEIGRTLWRENLKSVAIRYPNDTDGTRPGPNSFRDGDVDTYTYRRPSKRITPDGVYAAVACYQYQCAEYEAWDQQTGAKWTTTLREALEASGVRKDRALDQNPWGYTEDDVHGASVIS